MLAPRFRMTFGEVVHYVPHSNAWPESVRAIASLLLPVPDQLSFDGELPASTSSGPSDNPAAPSPGSYTATDFQLLIHSTATELKALAELPHYCGARSTLPLWSQLLHALANTLSPEALILEDAPFVMPRAQGVALQPPDLIDGQATLIAAHVIYSTPSTRSNRSPGSSQCRKLNARSVYSACSSPWSHSDRSSTSSESDESEDILMHHSDLDSCKGSVDSPDGLPLPLQAHMLPGRLKWHYAVIPVLLVADACNIVPLLCSALYQRRVWGICEPVVGLCCSNTGTVATAIFGWLDSDQSDDGRMPVVHLALSAGNRIDSSMGVFCFTDSSSAISLAGFILRLRSHFEDIRKSASMEAVNQLSPFNWRSDLPDTDNQIEGSLEDRVASWTHQVHVQNSSSDTSSSLSPRTPSPPPDHIVSLSSEDMNTQGLHTIHEEDVNGRKNSARPAGQRRPGSISQPKSSKDEIGSQKSSSRSHPPSKLAKVSSRLSNSSFAAISDFGLVEGANISNWLLERNTFTVGRIMIQSDNSVVGHSGINEMVKKYDQMTAFTWSDIVPRILSNSTIDTSVVDIKDQLLEKHAGGNYPSMVEMPEEDVKFISARFSALLHAVKGARGCQGIANLRGANEAERRHEWDALSLKFFQPVSGQRDVLLERQLNFPRNPAVDNAAFGQQAISFIDEYEMCCLAQHGSYLFQRRSSPRTSRVDYAEQQTFAAVVQSRQFRADIDNRILNDRLLDEVANHSRREPEKGICDAILVIPCSGAVTAMLDCIESKTAQNMFLKSFLLVHGKPDKEDAARPTKEHHEQTDNVSHLRPPPVSHVSTRQQQKERKAMLQNVYLVHPDRMKTSDKPLEIHFPEASGRDLLLPILLSEYKKKDESTIAKAMNQMRTYLVSAIRFLDALGITDQPVFGLVVNGCLGAVTMGWKKNEKVYIMERNVRHFDITDPLDAFQFVSVLLRLARHGIELRARFDEKKGALYESLRTSTYTPWSKLAQIDSTRDDHSEVA